MNIRLVPGSVLMLGLLLAPVARADAPYGVRCNGGPAVTSRQWLRDELARFRTFDKKTPTILLVLGTQRKQLLK